MRRGGDVAESWTFPEANNAGHCAVEVDTGSGFDGRVDVDMPFAAFTPGVLSVRVA